VTSGAGFGLANSLTNGQLGDGLADDAMRGGLTDALRMRGCSGCKSWMACSRARPEGCTAFGDGAGAAQERD
jgi:hypothetical protein